MRRNTDRWMLPIMFGPVVIVAVILTVWYSWPAASGPIVVAKASGPMKLSAATAKPDPEPQESQRKPAKDWTPSAGDICFAVEPLITNRSDDAPTILLAVDAFALERMLKYIIAGDGKGVQELLADERIHAIKQLSVEVKVIFIHRASRMVEVRITDENVRESLRGKEVRVMLDHLAKSRK